VKYQRDIEKALLIYRVTLALLLTGSLRIMALKAYVYLPFIAVAYLIRDFIFPIYFVSITESVLTVKRIFLGGLFVKKIIIDRNGIFEVTNIDAGVTTTSEIDFENGIFSGGDGTDRKKFELYRIKSLDKSSAEKTIKVPLASIEANLLSEQLLPTTSGL
jgi:hypothetical protein